MKNIVKISLLFLIVGFLSCNKVILNPNSTLEPELTSSTKNLARLINGIQQRWSTDRKGVIYNVVHLSGLSTGELRLLNPGNLAENQILLGGKNVNGDNEILKNLWTQAMLCRKEATTVINAADKATSDVSMSNSLKAYALFYKAIVNGTMIQFFKNIPLEIKDDAPFIDREKVLENAISDLETAKGYIEIGLSSEITSSVFNSVDLKNSVNALLARFNLILGNYDAAIKWADAVNLTKKSVWDYDTSIPNPLAFWFGSQNVAQAKDINFGLPRNLSPDINDRRISFYVKKVGDTNFQLEGFWKDNLSNIPVYLPGEIMLIKAEAYLRKGELTQSITQLNAVLTKTPVNDLFGLGANLPVYSGKRTKKAILEEIYRNRRIELYLTGLSIEDTRRFKRPGATELKPERNRDFYPYPNIERDNNKSTPANPPD